MSKQRRRSPLILRDECDFEVAVEGIVEEICARDGVFSGKRHVQEFSILWEVVEGLLRDTCTSTGIQCIPVADGWTEISPYGCYAGGKDRLSWD